MNKTCTRCGVSKDIQYFSLDKNRPDGHFPHCKDCTKKYKSKYWDENKNKISIQRKKEYPDKRKKILDRMKEYYKINSARIIDSVSRYRRTDKGRLVRKNGEIEYKKKYPEKRKASEAVNRAVYSNKIPRASSLICAICNTKQAKHYHHHKGYDEGNWLDVIPVCIQCHNNIHHKNGG